MNYTEPVTLQNAAPSKVAFHSIRPERRGFRECGSGVFTGLSTTGTVRWSQVRALGLRTRNGKLIERAPGYIVDLVLDCLRDILE